MLSERTCVRFSHFKPFLLCVRLKRSVDIVTVTNHNVSSLTLTVKVCGGDSDVGYVEVMIYNMNLLA